MITRIIHQCWFGRPPPDDIAHFMHTVRVQHTTWSYMLWDESNVDVLGQNVSEEYGRLKNWASVSNLVRLVVLKKFGGIYLDTDVECLKSFEPLRICNAFAALQDNEEINGNKGRLCNAVMGAEPEHPWINWQIEHFNDFDQQDPASSIYLASTAPRDGLTLIPPHLVYPFHWDDPAEKRKPHPESIAVHWWKGGWR